MSRTFYAAILKCNTQALQDEGIANRKERIEAGLKEASNLIQSKFGFKDNLGRMVFGIFVAPEYTFSKSAPGADHAVGDTRHLDEGTKISLENWIKGLSTKYPKMLIFPGSIAWKKPFKRDLESYIRNKEAINPGNSRAKLTEKFKSKTQSRQQKALASIGRHNTVFQGNNDTRAVSGHKYEGMVKDNFGNVYYETTDSSGLPFNGKLYTPNPGLALIKHKALSNKEKKDTLNIIQIDDVTTAMARNTCHVYLNGKLQMKYHKQNDYHEVLVAEDKTVYVPGNRKPTFTADGVVFGVEICLDHIMATINKVHAAGEITTPPDVLVLMSAQVSVVPANVPNNAMVIHACSAESNNLVGKGGIKNASATYVTTLAHTEIYSFDL